MDAPTLPEFLQLAERGNLIPVTRRLLADFETPLSAYWKLRGQGESFLFESVEGGEHLGRYSFVGCNPRAVIKQTGDRVEVIEGGRVRETFQVVPRSKAAAGAPQDPSIVADGLEVVQRLLARFKPVPMPGLPRFTGGAVGFLGYEFIHDVEPVVPRPKHDELGTPTLYFLITDELLIFDRVAQTLTVLVNAIIEPGQKPEEAYENAVGEIERLTALLEQPVENHPVGLPAEVPPVPFVSNTTPEAFYANVRRAKEFIVAGDIIQVVGSQRFSTPVKAQAFDLYRAARSINPSPYMFLLELEGFALVGASPELHVRCVDRQVEIRPIAGTRARGKTEAEDESNARDLLADPKERAEHLMLLDLGRNDVGRVAQVGSVHVAEQFVIERYSHVMHICSHVEGKIDAKYDAIDALLAGFPAGTLSGAPKVRAMEIIDELEPERRNLYGGAIGYFAADGSMDTCIVLRTAIVKDGQMIVQAGCGVVADSNPAAEHQEINDKARALFRAAEEAVRFARD